MSRRTTKTAAATLDDLRALARLEGRPLPRGQALADALGVSPSAAWKYVRRLKRLGALAFVSSVQRPPGICECITYVQVRGTRPGELALLDARLAADPLIIHASRVAGDFDYRLRSLHRNYRSANDWSRSLEADPNVSRISTRFSTTVFERPHYAAAILGTGST
jgi:DNA-binding Lrp family transcriptional regulator